MRKLFFLLWLMPFAAYAGGFMGGNSGTRTKISHAHDEIHEGNHYFLSDLVTLGAAGTRKILFVTPNTTEHAHLTGNVLCTDECIISFYEDATASANGTALTPRNLNRTSSNTSSVLVYHTPTITDAGTLLQTGQIGKDIPGVGGIAGTFTQRTEWILDANSKYYFLVTATSADTDVSTVFEYYLDRED